MRRRSSELVPGVGDGIADVLAGAAADPAVTPPGRGAAAAPVEGAAAAAVLPSQGLLAMLLSEQLGSNTGLTSATRASHNFAKR